MNLRKSFTSVLAASAMLVGMTSGLVSAQADSDTENTNLNVVCPVTSTVDLTVNGDFTVDMTTFQPLYDAHLPGGFEIEMDLSCNWTTDFQVSAEIGTFTYQDGPVEPGQLPAFGGAHLYWDNGAGVYNGPDIYLLAGAPNVEGTVFEFLQTNDPDVIENGYDTFIFWNVPVASPGVTVATWDGHLFALPFNLAPGLYTAPLTVELTIS